MKHKTAVINILENWATQPGRREVCAKFRYPVNFTPISARRFEVSWG